jgi:hypothetical protein
MIRAIRNKNNNYKQTGTVMWLLIGLLVLLSLSAPTQALDSAKPISDFIHETWSVDDGLPQSTVRSIAQHRADARRLYLVCDARRCGAF